MVKKHDERCTNCKTIVVELLNSVFGEVFVNYNLNLPSKVEDYTGSMFEKELRQIHLLLQGYRGHKIFVKSKKLPNVDFFVPYPGFILEFDESQHFTKPREIALSNYPDALTLGFDKNRWRDLCVNLNKKDNDSPYRDEQRAWYDTLRDFAPSILKIKPTIRLYTSDYVWCSLDPKSELGQEQLRKLLGL